MLANLYLYIYLCVCARVGDALRGDAANLLDDLWGNDFTGSAPGCETVEDDDVVLEGFGEGGFAAWGC